MIKKVKISHIIVLYSIHCYCFGNENNYPIQQQHNNNNQSSNQQITQNSQIATNRHCQAEKDASLAKIVFKARQNANNFTPYFMSK